MHQHVKHDRPHQDGARLDRVRLNEIVTLMAFAVGVAQSLDLPDRSFDVVTSTLAAHHIPDEERAAAFGEMFRVLRPGGALPAADFRPGGRRHTPHAFASAKRHGSAIPLEELATAAGFRVEARGELPVLRYIRAVRPLGT